MTANKIMTPKTKRQFANPPKMNRMARQSSLQLLIQLEPEQSLVFYPVARRLPPHSYIRQRTVRIEADNNRDNSSIGKFGANIPIILLIIKWPSILSKRCARTFSKYTH